MQDACKHVDEWPVARHMSAKFNSNGSYGFQGVSPVPHGKTYENFNAKCLHVSSHSCPRSRCELSFLLAFRAVFFS